MNPISSLLLMGGAYLLASASRAYMPGAARLNFLFLMFVAFFVEVLAIVVLAVITA